MYKLQTLITFFVVGISALSVVSPDLCLKENGEPVHVSFVSIPTKGHINPFIGSAQQLSRLGCRVTIPIGANKTHWVTPYEEIEIIEVPTETDISVEDRRAMSIQNANIFAKFMKMFGRRNNQMRKLVFDMVLPLAEFLLEEHSQGRYSPDIFVTEKMLSSLGDIGLLVGAEVVFLNPSLIMNWDGPTVHYVPGFSSGLPLEMSYLQRVFNYYVPSIVLSVIKPLMFAPIYELREHLGVSDKLPPLILAANFTGLELTQTFFGLEYAQPLPPNHNLVGPILPLTLKQLPERITNWIENNSDSPIYYMCMGTIATLTDEMIKPLMEAFKDQPYSVIWSFPENQRDMLEGITIPSNVILEDFVPQRELLLQEKIVAFITHTGASSSYEAVTSGTPVICIPFMGDQFEFCNRFVSAGSAIQLDKFTLSVPVIREAMNKIITESYVNNAKRLQKLAASSGGAMKVAELILSSYHDGVQHLIPNSKYLPWYQSTAIDLAVTQFLFVFFLPFILYFFFKFIAFLFSCCLKRRNQKKMKKE